MRRKTFCKTTGSSSCFHKYFFWNIQVFFKKRVMETFSIFLFNLTLGVLVKGPIYREKNWRHFLFLNCRFIFAVDRVTYTLYGIYSSTAGSIQLYSSIKKSMLELFINVRNVSSSRMSIACNRQLNSVNHQ